MPIAVAALAVLGVVGGGIVVARDDAPVETSARTPVTVAPAMTASPSPVPSALPSPTPSRPASLPTQLRRPPAQPTAPVAASDPAGLAEQLRSAAQMIASEQTEPRHLAHVAHVQQVALRKLVNTPGLRQPTYDLLEPALRAAVVSDVTAGAALRAMLRRPKTTLPQWRIVKPAPAAELLGYYRDAQREFGVPWQYLASIHLVETRMGRIRGVSSAGAQGPMQFMPATWRAYGGGGDIHSNRDSIRAAARYLKASGAPGRMRKAVYAYNRDDRYVDAVLLHAERMGTDPRAYYGYHGWQVYYVMTTGDRWLPEGFANE